MSDNVIKLVPEYVGENYRLDVDECLESAKGRGIENVLIIGDLEDGELWVSSASNAGEALILIEKARQYIVFGERRG